MQPASMSLPWWATERPDRDLIRTGAICAAVQVAVILTAAAAVWALAPGSWQSLIDDEQHTDAGALAVIAITANNLLICCLPVLAGVYAHRLARHGRTWWAWAVLALAGLIVIRSLLVIGLVGGLDPAWLAGAAAWWLAEIAALAVCCAAGFNAARAADELVASRQLAHAVAFACLLLPCAAIVEVALT